MSNLKAIKKIALTDEEIETGKILYIDNPKNISLVYLFPNVASLQLSSVLAHSMYSGVINLL